MEKESNISQLFDGKHGADILYFNWNQIFHNALICLKLNVPELQRPQYEPQVTIHFHEVTSVSMVASDGSQVLDFTVTEKDGMSMVLLSGADIRICCKSIEVKPLLYRLAKDIHQEKDLMDQYTEQQSLYLQKQFEKLKICSDFHEDSSFNGVVATHHIMYKMETLYNKDKSLGYEFLIEMDVDEPSLGIYYGCKVLILNEQIHESIAQVTKEWEDIIRPQACRVLNNVFVHKNFERRFLKTDNANDRTFWPFWISLEPDEGIVDVAAEATRIIRRIYEIYLNGDSFSTKPEPEKPKYMKSELAFTREACDNLLNVFFDKKTDTDNKSKQRNTATLKISRFHNFIDQCIANGILELDKRYEHAYKVCDMPDSEFSYLIKLYFERKILNLDDKGKKIPWEQIQKVFLNQDGYAFQNMRTLPGKVVSDSVIEKMEKLYRDLFC